MGEVIVYTTAPIDYDWGWATSEETEYETDKGDPIRKVTISDEWHGEFQTGRYHSGMYPVYTELTLTSNLIHGYIRIKDGH